MLSQACPRISTKSLFRMHRVPFSGGAGVPPYILSSSSPSVHLVAFSDLPLSTIRLLVRLCKLRSAIRTFLRGSKGLRIAAALQSFLSRARYRNNSACQVARKYTQRLYDRSEIRFTVPSHLRASPAALRQTISRDVSRSLFGPFVRYKPNSFGLCFELRILLKEFRFSGRCLISSTSHVSRLKVPACT